ncbi:MAG: TIGR00725 family protein [Solirubrobacterales bacterium]
MRARAPQVSVAGSGRCGQASEEARAAAEVGALLAERGVTVVCGGLGGVMEAVSRGAAERGGEVIGIVPGSSAEAANPFCTRVVVAGVGEARNLAVAASGEALIAIGGAWGTLSEIALARKLGRRVVLLGGWSVPETPAGGADPGVLEAGGPAEAVALALGPAQP